MNQTLHPELFQALALAAEKHQYQRRAGYDQLPYINHLIKVTNILIETEQETDPTILIASILHDSVEDTDLTFDDLKRLFGESVAKIVLELTDDMQLDYAKRKQLQVEGAKNLSVAAKKIRIADKICNIQDIFTYPLNWTKDQKIAYLENSILIVDEIRGTSQALENRFDILVSQIKQEIQY